MSETEAVFAVLLLVSVLINALQAFWNNQSIPKEFAEKIFTGAKYLASLNDIRQDDEVINALHKLYNDLSARQETQPHNPSESRD